MTDKTCPFELAPEVATVIKSTLARTSDKWSMIVIAALQDGALRYNEVRRRTGATQKMLTRTLRGLERDGYVNRIESRAALTEVYYDLTDLGRDALGPVMAFVEWASAHVATIEAARARFDRRIADNSTR